MNADENDEKQAASNRNEIFQKNDGNHEKIWKKEWSNKARVECGTINKGDRKTIQVDRSSDNNERDQAGEK